jgi:hypothetical protein
MQGEFLRFVENKNIADYGLGRKRKRIKILWIFILL